MTHELIPHPAGPADASIAIAARVHRTPTALMLRFRVRGGDAVRWPAPGRGERRDGLWRTTCFEAFFRPVGAAGYVEVNASPSTDWAAYAFDAYRDGMQDAAIAVTVEQAGHGTAAWDVKIDVSAMPELAAAPLDVSLTAVMELVDGTIAYFALRHPAGKPDFHHADCFALRLEAPGTA